MYYILFLIHRMLSGNVRMQLSFMKKSRRTHHLVQPTALPLYSVWQEINKM